MKYPFILVALLSLSLSAQTLTIGASGDYILKTGESEEHGYRIATELAKQTAIEQAGTAVVSNFKIVRGSDGTDKAVLNASTYAAAVVKTEVVAKQNNAGHIRVDISATIDDSNLNDYLKSGPALHDRVADLSKENNDLKSALRSNLDDLDDLDRKYRAAVAGSVDEEEIDELEKAIAEKIDRTDTILSSLGEHRIKTGTLVLPKGALHKVSLKQQVKESNTETDKRILMGAVDKLYRWLSDHMVVVLDPASAKVSTFKGRSSVEIGGYYHLDNKTNTSISIGPDTVTFGLSEKQLRDMARHDIPWAELFTASEIEAMKTLAFPFNKTESVSIKTGEKTAVYTNRTFRSQPWHDIVPGSHSSNPFDCGTETKDAKALAQCELNRHTLSQTLALTVSVPGTNLSKSFPLGTTYTSGKSLINFYRDGVEHSLGMAGKFTVKFDDITAEQIASIDTFKTEVFVSNRNRFGGRFDEFAEIEKAVQQKKYFLFWKY